MKNRKKIILIVVIVVAAAAVILAVSFIRGFGAKGSGGDAAYVEAVSDMSASNAGTQNRYSGVVESQDTWDINLSPDQTVKEIFVAEGDEVQEGTPLFSYDTDDLNLQLSQAKLELEEIGNEIKNYNSQIKALQAEKKAASKDEQFNYTVQIQSLETSIKQAEYNRQSKQMEIDKLQNSLNQSTVTSKINGVIKSINENGKTDDSGNILPFMSVLTTGDYRVKGLINETNVWMIAEGQPVILRSRVDENQTWTGTIQSIDTENAESGNNNMYDSGDMDSTSQSSKYPFYVALDSSDGLMLGQHLYIELDEGQTVEKDGVWIYSGYLVYEDGLDASPEEEGLSLDEVEPAGDSPVYVWADNGKGKLEKRAVELGSYDEANDMYEILSGLSMDDYIAWPMSGFVEGMKTTTNMDDAMMEDDSEEIDEDYYMEEGVYDDTMSEDGVYDDAMSEDGVYDDAMPEDDVYDDAVSEGGTFDGDSHGEEAFSDGMTEEEQE